jgi:gliding motility associated protien GldN
MKLNNKLLVVAFTLVAFAVTTPLNAQKGKGKGGTTKKTGGASSSNPFGGGSTTPPPPATNNNKPNTTQGNNKTSTQSSSNSNPFGSSDPFGGGGANKGTAQPPANNKPAGGFNKNLPIEVQKAAGGDPLTDTIKPGLRNGSAIVSMVKDRAPLAYDDIREDDAIYRQRIWEVIDCREKINLPFMYKEDGGNNLFFAILIRAILEDSVAAFEHYDFRKQLKNAEVQAKCTGGMDTVQKYDLEGNVVGLSVGKKEFPIDSVYEFQLLEEVIFDKEAAKLVRRIIAIAPMGPAFIGGRIIPGEHFPYFWVYYPDLRRTLAKKYVYNVRNIGSNQTWEDYLENHRYSYYITKSSLDNVKDLKLKDYIKDPLFRLFEGEKIKTQIFNYEQGLWAY